MLKCCFLTASKFVKVGIFVMDNEYVKTIKMGMDICG